MDGKYPEKHTKRLVCRSNPGLTNALHDYMAAQAIETEGRAVETLVREGLTKHGHLAPKAV